MSTYYTDNERYGVYDQLRSSPRTEEEMAANRQKSEAIGTQAANGRTAQIGTAKADETFLTDASYAKVQQYKNDFAKAQEQYNAAKAQGAGDDILQAYQRQMDAAHAGAEAIRAGSGYSGGADGSQYLVNASQSSGDGRTYSGGTGGTGGGASINPATQYGANKDAQAALLEQWKAAATQQANAKIDYGVSTSTKELERALQDAQPQFQEQAESVARDERQAMDNSALYAELRGDKGGIGQAQYNEIQAQAAKNRLAVQQAQTKLSTDTARQIEDLRAQGEFQKADAALQISQQYLSQLMSLEKWAAEYNLSAAQFEASIQEWEYEYQLSMAQLNQNQQQFNAQMQYNYAALGQNQNQFNATMGYNTSLNTQKQMASMGSALLSAGIMPTTEQLTAMGMTQDQATQYIQAAQLAAAAKGSGGGSGGTGGGKGGSTGADALVEAAIDWAAKTGGDPADFISANYGKYGTTKTAALATLNIQQSETKGMDEARFAELLRNIDMTAKNATGASVDDSVSAKVNSVWGQLTLEQKRRLNALLSKYYNIG